MTKNMFVITILMAILVLPIIPHTKLSVVQQNSFVLGESVYQDSPPIQIDYAGAYEYLADYGNGTSINPFVIENKSIDLSVYDDYDVGITIKYNSSYAIIRNCFFNGITTETGLGGIGIQIWHAANIVIENCIINSTARGVEIYDANTVAIIGNTFLGDSTRETGTGSWHGDAVDVDWSYKITIHDNEITKTAKAISTYDFMTGIISNNNVVSNTIGITLNSNSSYVNATDNRCNYNYVGIRLDTTEDIRLERNICGRNDLAGILLAGSIDAVVDSNVLIGNGNDTVTEVPTLADEGNGYGLSVRDSGSGNNITNNEFIYNLHNCVDDVGSVYDKNYWSDYLGYDIDGDSYGDTPYIVEGTSESVDNNPRGPNTSTTSVGSPIPMEIVAIVALSGVAIVIVVTVIIRSKRK